MLLVDRIADALLYEGYVLYPYRPAVKNRQRWTFGGLMPRTFSEAHAGSDPWLMRTECLIRGNEQTTLHIRVRFLHFLARIVWQIDTAGRHRVESLRVDDRIVQTWQEATERTIAPDVWRLGTLAMNQWRGCFTWPASRSVEPIRSQAGIDVGLIVREQHSIKCESKVAVENVDSGVFKLSATIENQTPLEGEISRDEAMLLSLVSTHVILSIRDGDFLSLIDPPNELRAVADRCQNVGAWPVLVGKPGDTDTMLAAPMILYDYPQIADASPGDLFDSTEIDEILTLRIQTLTDEEKLQAAAVDERVRTLLERTEALECDQIRDLHGAWNFESDLPKVEHVQVGDVTLQPGDRVRLKPCGRADILDLALVGKAARIASIEQDFEGRIYLAVTLDDDPGRDFGLAKQPGHRFFFGVEEVEPLSASE